MKTQTVEWIPVEDSLPEGGDVEYPVAGNNSQAVRWTGVAVFRYGQWVSPDDCEYVYRGVTHYAKPLIHPDDLPTE